MTSLEPGTLDNRVYLTKRERRLSDEECLIGSGVNSFNEHMLRL